MASELVKEKQPWIEFIQLYKENPCLWQKKYNKPGAHSERILAYNLILEKYWEFDKDATVDTVKRKIHMFRGGVRREHKKIQEHSNYESKLWYYPYFKFIIDEMRAKCCVYGCKSATYNKHGLKHLFHRFPKDLKRLQIWKQFCKKTTLNSKSHKNLWICSRHFEKTMYINDLLKRSAIPTLNPPTKHDKEFDEDDLEYMSHNDITSASGSAAKLKPEHKSDSEQKQWNATSEVIETIVKQEEDDCESVTFSSEEEGSEEDVALNNDDEISIMEFVKEEYQPIPSTSNEPVAIGSKLSLGDNTVQPVYESTTAVYESLPDSGVEIEVLPHVSSIRSAASPASVTKVELEDDDCGTFAAHVNARMRNFSPGQKIIAQKLISDILFMADLQQLQMGSAVVHVQGQSVGPPNGAPAVKRPKGSFLAYLDSEDNRPSTSKMKK